LKRGFLHIFFLFLFLITAKVSEATHIVGGEIFYDALGGNNYKITLRVYRDCFNGQAPFDNPAIITVLDKNNNVITILNLSLLSVTNIPPTINSPCIQTPNTVCVEEGLYEGTVNLPPLNGGYYIVYQRCCRNNTILNLVSPGNVGATYYEHIPGPEVVATNSSPRYKKFPPIFLCNGVPFIFDHSATDPDGDQLVYSLCAPYEGLTPSCPVLNVTGCPTSATPYPYTPVPYTAGYNGSYPLSSNPALNINSVSGSLSGTPNMNGQWVVGVCVQEFRAGNLIATHYRDFQFNIVSCVVTVVSAIQTQNQLCQGMNVNFGNNSFGGNAFHWDFGVPTITNDTSNLVSTNYTYPDTGQYVVTLIANPGTPCSDTAQQKFYVYPKFTPTFTSPAGQCITGNSFNFNIGGLYAPYTTFNWNFGSNATPATSTAQSPTAINYSVAGTKTIKVIMRQAICYDTLQGNVVVYQKPLANFNSTPVSACDPAVVTISNTSGSNAPTTYFWEFSDGQWSTDKDPTHTFSPSGVYSVTLTIITNLGCIDTSKFVVPNYVTVHPKPVANFSFTPTDATIFDPDIYFTDLSQNSVAWTYYFGDGNVTEQANPVHTYLYYGDFPVSQLVQNVYGCTDTITKTVTILPEHRFWIPNCFTPGNLDGLNDVFMPSLTGIDEYEFYIFDRWGKQIFWTKNPLTGWDGSYKGKPCQEDVYVWLIKFQNVVTRRHEEHYGNVTLLPK
jgi:gliding motility-associated-like protein